jgi:hypothetical protein
MSSSDEELSYEFVARQLSPEKEATFLRACAENQELALMTRLLEGLASAFAVEAATEVYTDSNPNSSFDAKPENSPSDTLAVSSLKALTLTLGATDTQTVASIYRRVRDEFSPMAWQAFWAVEVEGKSPSSVALNLAIPEIDVQVHAHRIGQRLTRELGA